MPRAKKPAEPIPVEPIPRKRGGQPKPDAEKARSVNTTVPAVVHEYLTELGNGSASRGIRAAACEAYSLAQRRAAKK